MDITELIDRYCQVWTESDADRRAELLASVWGATATYTDPSVHAATAEDLLAHIATVQARRRGSKVLVPAESMFIMALPGLRGTSWKLTAALCLKDSILPSCRPMAGKLNASSASLGHSHEDNDDSHRGK